LRIRGPPSRQSREPCRGFRPDTLWDTRKLDDASVQHPGTLEVAAGLQREGFRQQADVALVLTEAWEYLGLVRARTGDAEGAVTAYRRATDVDPANGRAWFAIGGLLVQQGRCTDAVMPLQKAAERLPSMSEPLRYLGLCLLRTGDRGGGVAALREALVRNPQDNEARALLEGVPGQRSE